MSRISSCRPLLFAGCALVMLSFSLPVESKAGKYDFGGTALLRLSGGAAYLANKDQQQFADPTARYLQFPASLAPEWGAELAYLGLSGFTFGYLYEAGPDRRFSVYDTQMDWSTWQMAVSPGWCFVTDSKGFLTVAVKGGFSLLQGSRKVPAGSVDLGASTFYYSPFIRCERVLAGHLLYGLELGYTSAFFLSIRQGATTIDAPWAESMTLRNLDGTEAHVDDSGIYFKLSVSLCYRNPIRPKADAGGATTGAATASASPAGSTDCSQAKQLMAGKRYQEAAASLKKCLEQEPGNFEAWQTLGTACYYLRDRQCAIAAYEKALEINPNNTSLRAFLDKIRSSR